MFTCHKGGGAELEQGGEREEGQGGDGDPDHVPRVGAECPGHHVSPRDSRDT